MKKLIAFSTILLVGLSGVLSPGLYAQDTLEEIVVTARKRQENLSEIPLAITVFSAEDIEESGFKNLEDLSLQVAGFQHSAQGGQAPGRVNSQLRFRGMNVNSLSEDPSLNVATMFLDGIYVIGGYHTIPLEEVERVEVVKGPQSALYGRSTFGGAVNYITKDPNSEEFQGKASLLIGEDGERMLHSSIEGPITDALSGRLAAKFYERDGIFTASDGGEMGAEETKNIMGTLVAKGDNYKMKLRIFHSKDHDGSPAGGLVVGYLNDTCTGKSVSTNDPNYPTVSPKLYMCGMVPGPGDAIAINGSNQIIDMTTVMPEASNDWLSNQLPLSASFLNKVPDMDPYEYGMRRDITRISLNSSFDLNNGMTLETSWGFNSVQANWVRDFDYTAKANWTARDPYRSYDRSFDVKLVGNDDGRLRWLVGLNRYEQDFIHRGQGGAAHAMGINAFGLPVEGYYFKVDGAPCGSVPGTKMPYPASLWFIGCGKTLDPWNFLNFGIREDQFHYKGTSGIDTAGGNNSDIVISHGVYASVDYDINDQLTLSTEVRWSHEEISQYLQLSSANTLRFDNILPRVILRYKASENSMFYGSYSVGVLPGKANDAIASATPYEYDQYVSQFPNAKRFLEEEELDSIEIGWKGTVGIATVSVALYSADWEGQKGRSVAAINETCRAGDIGLTTYYCSEVGVPKLVSSLSSELYINTRNFNVMGDSEISGIEIEGSAQVTDKLSITGTLGMADSEYSSYFYNFVQPFAGFEQMAGNTMPRYPEDMASLSATYRDTLNNGWDIFIRGDVNYFGETYADESNLAKCDSYTKVNARGGIERDDLRIELYVSNLTDEDAYSACARWTDFATPNSFAFLTASQGVSISPMRPRNIGLRISYDF